MPRITLTIDKAILGEIQALAKKERRAPSRVLSQLLAQALAERRIRSEVPRLRWISRPMHALVDLADKEAVRKRLANGEP